MAAQDLSKRKTDQAAVESVLRKFGATYSSAKAALRADADLLRENSAADARRAASIIVAEAPAARPKTSIEVETRTFNNRPTESGATRRGAVNEGGGSGASGETVEFIVGVNGTLMRYDFVATYVGDV